MTTILEHYASLQERSSELKYNFLLDNIENFLNLKFAARKYEYLYQKNKNSFNAMLGTKVKHELKILTEDSILFENNDQLTRNKFIDVASVYLKTLELNGLIDTFNVICDESNNHVNTISNGEFHADIQLDELSVRYSVMNKKVFE